MQKDGTHIPFILLTFRKQSFHRQAKSENVVNNNIK